MATREPPKISGPRGPRRSLQQRPSTAPSGPRSRHSSSPMMSLTSASSSLQHADSLQAAPETAQQDPIPSPAYPIPPSRASLPVQHPEKLQTLLEAPDVPEEEQPSPVTPSTFKLINQPTPLAPPPHIKFEPALVQWKGLPLEAALCMSHYTH